MRIALRDSILGILDTILDGLRYAAAGGEGGAAVLEDCAAGLESIASALTESLSPERDVFYQRLISGIDFSGDDSETGIISLCQELENEPEVKLEVAFFPYKASMWDSLESVWLAARDDPRCNAVVVPIPYYDKRPDGSLGGLHYEGGDFPDYVPIVRYEDYKPELMQPELAYIHNPYDNNNRVTSVHPAWYSHELKKYVYKLVYVPYYVSSHPSNAEMSYITAHNGADVFVAFSHKESEAILAHVAEKDVPVLGSPKIDRVLRLEAEKPEIPVEWKPVLEGKKVFLLLTTINTILFAEGMNSGSKLERIFDSFEGRDDIALIWRPHPLEQSTMSAMRPELLELSRKLERRAAESEYCVVDKSADVERAIALSDAYIGSSISSVCYMFQVTGKPVYAVDFDSTEVFTEADYDEALHAEYLTGPMLDGDYLWGSCANFNGLARVDTRDGSMEYIAEIPGEYKAQNNLFCKAVRCGDKLILSPRQADCFIEYNIKTGEFSAVELPEEARVEDGNFAFGGAVEYNSFFYFIPAQSRAFCRYNMLTGEYEYFYGWFDKFEKHITRDDLSFFTGAALEDNALHLGSVQNNIISTLNLETMDFSVVKIGKEHYRYHGIVKSGKYFWMTRSIDNEFIDTSDSLVRWDSKSGKVVEFNDFPEDFKMYKLCHAHLASILDCGEHLIALPVQGNMFVKIDKSSGRMSKFDIGLEIDFHEREKSIFNRGGSFASGYFDGESTLYLTMLYDYSLLKIDLKTGWTQKVKQRFTGDVQKKTATNLHRFIFRHTYNENALFPPERFVEEYLAGAIPAQSDEQAEYYKCFIECADGSSGKKIHSYVMETLVEE